MNSMFNDFQEDSGPKGAQGYTDDIIIPLTEWVLAAGDSPTSGAGNVRRKVITGTMLGLEFQAATNDMIVWPGRLPGNFRVGTDVVGNKPGLMLVAAVKLTHATPIDQPALLLNAQANWLNPTFDPNFNQIDTPGETGVQTLDAVVQADPPPASVAANVYSFRELAWKLPDQMVNTILAQSKRSRLQPNASFQITLQPSAALAAATTLVIFSTALRIVRNTGLYEPYFRSIPRL